MGSCATPLTVAFCKGMTVLTDAEIALNSPFHDLFDRSTYLSKLATEMTSIPFPGLDVNHEPNPPSLPGHDNISDRRLLVGAQSDHRDS